MSHKNNYRMLVECIDVVILKEDSQGDFLREVEALYPAWEMWLQR